jgi:hypothetical protein
LIRRGDAQALQTALGDASWEVRVGALIALTRRATVADDGNRRG